MKSNRILRIDYNDIRVLTSNTDMLINYINKYTLNDKTKKTIKFFELKYIEEEFVLKLKRLFINIALLKNDMVIEKEIEDIIDYIIQNHLTIESFEEIYYDITFKIIQYITNDTYNDLDLELIEEKNILINTIKKMYSVKLNEIYVFYNAKKETLKREIRKKLESDFLFMYNGSNSDILNNSLSLLQTRNITLSSFIRKIKDNVSEMYTKNEFIRDEQLEKFLNLPNIDMLIDKENIIAQKKEIHTFYDNFSKLFSNQNIDKNFLEFVLKFMTNCFRFLGAKNRRKINVIHINKLNQEENNKINIHEFPLMISLFIIYKNAVERNSENVILETFEDEEYVYIDIIDDGDGINIEHKDLIFLDFFTTKSNENHYGHGLTIRVNELEKYDSKVFFISSEQKGDKKETKFRITINKI